MTTTMTPGSPGTSAVAPFTSDDAGETVPRAAAALAGQRPGTTVGRPMETVQRAVLTAQKGCTDALQVAIGLADSPHSVASLRTASIELQLAAISVQEAGIAVQESIHALTSMGETLGAVDSTEALLAKSVGDELLALGAYQTAASRYERALKFLPDYAAAEDNLAVAHLMDNKFEAAELGFRRMVQRDRSLPDERQARFIPQRQSVDSAAPASPFKLQDRADQLTWLVENGRLHDSFTELAVAHGEVAAELLADDQRTPYSALSQEQLERLGGYYDRLLWLRDSPRLDEPAINPDLDFDTLEERYRETRALYFDDLLTEAALVELQQFFRESTVFFRHSEAGFVGSYLTDGAATGLVLQIADELRRHLPNVLGRLPVNNMWCYRYGCRGEGVRAHNGDGSVTINFWLTDDDSNLSDPGGGGLIMYDKAHPEEWDWKMINARKDDPEIRANIAEYLSDATSFAIPYRCNRAALFHSTLFHKTDPFVFKDSYLDRRLNITMLFGRRDGESMSLQ